MALFTNLDLGVVKPLDLKDYKPTIGESMSIAWDAAMEQNPMQILARRQEMAGWEDGLELFDSRTGLDPTVDIDFEDFRLGREVHALPLEEQARQIKDAGLEGQVKPVEGYRQEALDIVMDSKRLENAAGLVSENQGLGGAVAGFGAGLAASFMDPINIASAFVPVAGEARVMSLMAGASGIGQRAAIRAGLGAASGALGAAMIEPMIYLGQQEVQADYTFANSMLNMSFGAIMGGVMHAGGGTFAEWRRARSGKAQPWEYVPPDDDSQALMQAHADDMARYEIEANPEANADFIREHALAEAELFNQKARAWAYHERKTVGEYYAQNRPEYRSWRDYFEPPKVDDGTGFEWRPDDVPSEVDTLFHLDDNGNAISPGENNPRIAKVVEVNPDLLVHGDGTPVNLMSRDDMFKWLREKGWNKYKDHKISKIEIAPSLYRDSGGNNISGAAQNQSAISGISLSVLKGDVKPSRIENNTLFQSTPSRSIVGKQTQILGANSKEIGRYEVREMDDVIASHDPENQFRRRENYPQEAQERPYHSDEGEQQKVVGNALKYEPAFVVSTDASATNGPPIITQNGIVLGGNSRTMTLQMVYGQHPEKAAAYRQALVDNASQFGIDPQAIANMKRPMLVRVVSGQFSPEDMAKRSREYNQTTTQQLQGEAEGISRARFVDKPTVNALIAGLQDGRTIDQFLASPESADFARVLQDAGVLQQQEVAALTLSGKGASGKLNDAGKARVKMIMRGLVLPDYDVMTSLPKGVLDNLDAAIPGLALSRFRGEGFDLTGAFYDAMRFVAKANNEGTPVEHQFFQHTMIGADPMQDNAVVQALAMTFANADTREIRLRMEQFLELADSQSAGQASLMPGMGMTPQKAFRKSFLEPITFVGNERIANFKPDANSTHAAIQWAIENGGKNPTVEKALAHIEKKLAAKKTTPEDRAILSEYQRELAPLSGALGTREPKLGQFFKDPGKLEIPAPKKAGERGALPEATATREPAPMSDPDANLPPELQAEPQVQSPRGQVQFDAETGRAVVTFFQSADVSTAPHELFHIFRREMERTALAADGSAHAREQWRKACEFVGAKDGQAWSREMEEKFANAGLQYLREGRAPTPGLRGLFERLKTWFMDLYQKAEDLGVEISPQMREVFDGMFTVPYDAADRSFRYAMGDIHSRQVERDFADPATSGGRFAAEDQRLLDAEKSGDAALVDQLMRDAQVRADEAVRRLEQSSPELRGLVDEANLEIAEIDRQIEHNNIRDEFRRQALECQWNGG